MAREQGTEDGQGPQNDYTAGEAPATVDTPSFIDPRLPQEAQDKLRSIQKKLDEFKDKLISRFEGYIAGIALLPPDQPPQQAGQQGAPQIPQQGGPTMQPMMQQMPPQPDEPQQEYNPDAINVLVLIDDTDSQKMSKEELRDKLTRVINDMAAEVDKNLAPRVLIYTELWQNCYDGKHDLLQMIAASAPVYDLGMLSAVKIAEVHKSMVLKKFEKYIVSYVLAGSLVQGKATPTSDIDVFIVIDDTDVKKMTRAELKDKLRAIIIGMGGEAGHITGIQNKFNIQVYILTDFWESIKEANPVIFTFLRDGVPFYDRGIFMPWKQLLRMGKIRPSMEAIDIYMSSGQQSLDRAKATLKTIGMEDFFWAVTTPSQAVLMLYGVAPPTPKETPGIMRDIFVKKEKVLEEKYIKTLEKIIKLRKDLEHGSRTVVTGKEIDDLIEEATAFLDRINEVSIEIEKRKNEENVVSISDSIITMMRDILRLNNVEKVKDEDLFDVFKKEIVSQGSIPQKFVRIIRMVLKARKDYDAGKLSKVEVEKVRTQSQELIRFLVEYIQRQHVRQIERRRVRVKYDSGKKFGEVLLLEDEAYIVRDIDGQKKEVLKASIGKSGKLGKREESSFESMDEAIADAKDLGDIAFDAQFFAQLPELFGDDVEVLMGY
ncbi:MAG: nucleotidyltransferase domain-containing protein [Nanoarchaeota archaeon]